MVVSSRWHGATRGDSGGRRGPSAAAVVGAAAAGMALAVAAVLALVAAEYALCLLLVAIGVWLVVAPHQGAAGAALVTLTLGLPLFNQPIASFRSGVGLFTILLLAAAAVTAAAAAPRLRLPRWRHVLALGAFSGVVAASLVVAPRGDLSAGIAKTYAGRALLFPLLIAVVLATADRGLELAAVLRRVVVATGIVVAVLSIVQIALGRGYVMPPGAASLAIAPFVELRATGLSEHPNTSAGFLVIALSLALWRWGTAGGAAWGAVTFLLTLGLVLTGSRAGMLALCAVWLVGMAAARRTRRLSHLLASAAVFSLAATSALAFEGYRAFLAGGAPVAVPTQPQPPGPTGQPAQQGVEPRRDTDVVLGEGRLATDESASSRAILARAQVELGLRHPWTGIGLGNLGPSLLTIEGDYVRSLPGLVPGAPVDRHSAFAGVFSELGVPGLAAFFAVVAFAGAGLVDRLRRARSAEARALVGGILGALVATLIIGVFNDVDRHVFLWWLVGVAFGLDAALRRLAPDDDSELQHRPAVRQS